MIRICRRCKGRVMPEKGKLRKKYPYYCPTCYENMFSFETDKTALQEKDICMGNGYEGVEKSGGYKCMTMVFNDRGFEDGWTEPYILHMKLKTFQSAGDIAGQLAAIGQAYYEESSNAASIFGIHQIMDRLKAIHPELEYFIFGCPTVPFGDDISPYNITDDEMEQEAAVS